MKKRVAFIVPYPIGYAPSQRFRFEQYISLLEQDNYQIGYFPFLSVKDFQQIYKPGKFFVKIWATVKGFTKRFLQLFQLGKFDIIFIHRESSPVGPPFFEWYISKVLKKKIIYDFDDAIWLQNTSESNKVISGVKRHSKVGKICSWASMVFCGNHFLKEYAENFNSNTVYIPTTIDTNNHHNQIKEHRSAPITIGWTGTHTTAKYLKEIENILADLQKKHHFKIKLICNKDPEIDHFNYEFIVWKKESEIADLLNFDIGLMPLDDNDWAKGKCGFKALQYMSLEIPAIASPVGVNNKIISDGINGFLPKNMDEWEEKLKQLINDKELRVKLGKEGRKTVTMNYSVSALKEMYLSYFNQIVEQ